MLLTTVGPPLNSTSGHFFFRLVGDAFNLISPIHYFSLVSSLLFYFFKGTSSSYYLLPAGEFMRDHVFSGRMEGGGDQPFITKYKESILQKIDGR